MKINKTIYKPESVEIEVTLSDAIRVIEQEIGFGEDYVYKDVYYEWKYDHPHNGDPQYNNRPATKEEISRYELLKLLHKLEK